MARYAPRSQTPDVMARKAVIARALLARGLTVTQIRTQLACSAAFVHRIRREDQLRGTDLETVDQ